MTSDLQDIPPTADAPPPTEDRPTLREQVDAILGRLQHEDAGFRAAAAEALLAGALMIAEVRRAAANNAWDKTERIGAVEQRFTAALEGLRKALST